MNLIKKIFQNGLLVANLFANLLLILSAFSDWVPPGKAILFSYLGLAFPFILIINCCFTLGWFIILKWKIGLASMLPILLCWSSIHTYFPVHSLTKQIPDNCIKILTYNTMQFGHQQAHTNKKPNSVLKYMIDSKADIICIQEFSAFHKSKNHLEEATIIKALKEYPYHKIHKLRPSSQNNVFGLAVFSKYPITSIKDIPFNSEFNGAFIAELDIKGKKVTLINNHLESNKLSNDEREAYFELTKDFDSNKLESFRYQMTNRLTPAFKIREKQARMVSDLIKKNENPYIIVCGDFNDTPISYTHNKIKGNLRDAFVDSGNGLGISFNRYRFLFRIDYILHSKNIKAYNCTVDKVRYSDHYPVWTYLHLN